MYRVIPVVLTLLVGCFGTTTIETTTTTEPAATEPAAAPADAAPAAAPAAATFKLVSVTSGDHACYIELASAAGETITYPSSFDLCPGNPTDATPLIGKEVTATFEKTKIAAPECQGDPECTKSVEEDGVASLAAK
jgi:hypothetical protein